MFQSLKQKIAKETGQDVNKINFNNRSTSSSTNKMSSRNSICSNQSLDNSSSKDETTHCDEKEAEINILRHELYAAQTRIKELEIELERLKESLKVSKELILEESDKIHNAQQHEIEKLKNLLLFREQVNYLTA